MDTSHYLITGSSWLESVSPAWERAGNRVAIYRSEVSVGWLLAIFL